MRLGIDATFTPYGGSEVLLVNIINYFAKDKTIDLYVYTKKSNQLIIKKCLNSKITYKYSFISNISNVFRVIWGQIYLPFLVAKDKLDILFCPGNISPIFCSINKVQWIGNIAPFWEKIYQYPIGFRHRIEFPFNKYLMYKSALTSELVIFESKYAKDLFISKYNLNKNKSSVINIGKDEILINSKNVNYGHYNEYDPFVLCVAHLQPYKHIPEMINAFCTANISKNNKYMLLIAGERASKHYYKKIKSTIAEKRAENQVILLGSVSKEYLNILYSKCEFMIFPSPCENFSCTLVEAMSFGVPIVCSNTTAMPETCGNAAIYFDPFDVNNLTNKINLLFDNPKLKTELREKSLERVNHLLSYEEVVKMTVKLMYSIKN